ncbi:hypothetical protein Leryth_010624 [Lithospermum erythrorhizon]|nr:hypothetical protein Leryth_010624 [Lithospermum erythrorhizon]
MPQILPFVLLVFISTLCISGVYSASTFTLMNKCDYTVWPGMLSNAGIDPLPTSGFVLQKGESRVVSAPDSWGGRLWGRTHCTEDSSGKFSCLTGDCGSGKLECSGGGAAPPATLAEFTLNGHNNMDFYDVSLVDGYNLPMVVVPQGGSGINCTTTGCFVDLNGDCPSELKVMSNGGDGVACKSACEAFAEEQYCCSGAFGTPDTCKPSSYSEVFKKACPTAYSYAYDDKSSTFTCSSGAHYLITFCPSPNASQKSSSGTSGQVPPSGGGDGGNNGGGGGGQKGNYDYSMVYDGALETSSATSTCIHMLTHASGVAVVTVTLWLSSHLF